MNFDNFSFWTPLTYCLLFFFLGCYRDVWDVCITSGLDIPAHLKMQVCGLTAACLVCFLPVILQHGRSSKTRNVLRSCLSANLVRSKGFCVHGCMLPWLAVFWVCTCLCILRESLTLLSLQEANYFVCRLWSSVAKLAKRTVHECGFHLDKMGHMYTFVFLTVDKVEGGGCETQLCWFLALSDDSTLSSLLSPVPGIVSPNPCVVLLLFVQILPQTPLFPWSPFHFPGSQPHWTQWNLRQSYAQGWAALTLLYRNSCTSNWKSRILSWLFFVRCVHS